jgi:anti-anti-sigma factor
MQQTNQFRLEQQNDITRLYIRGDITAQSEPVINDAYKEANDRGAVKKILIQFEEDAYINSGGIAVLIQILAHTQKQNQQIGITGLSDHFKKIFNMVGIGKFAGIYDSAEDAVAAMSQNS